MKVNKWTCRCAEHVRVEGAVEGSKEEVLAWMKTHFPGLQETDASDVETWYRNYKGGVQQYAMNLRDAAIPRSQYLYLVEKIGDDTKEEAQKVLAEMNAFAEKTPILADDAHLAAFLDKMRSLGWAGLTDEITKKGGTMYAHYRLADPDSEEAISFSPFSQCLGDYAKRV